MKGLIQKDFLILKNQMFMFACVLVVYLFIGITTKDFSFFSTFLALFAGMLVINTCAYDDNSKWNVYAGTLPMKRTTIVLSKYIASLIFISIAIAISFLFNMVGVILDFAKMNDALIMIYILFLITVTFVAISMPIIYKYGVEKSRLIMIALIVVPYLLIMLGTKLQIQAPTESTIKLLMAVAPAVVLVILFISYNVSCRIFCKKDCS